MEQIFVFPGKYLVTSTINMVLLSMAMLVKRFVYFREGFPTSKALPKYSPKLPSEAVWLGDNGVSRPLVALD